jgi:hypothetical protein
MIRRRQTPDQEVDGEYGWHRKSAGKRPEMALKGMIKIGYISMKNDVNRMAGDSGSRFRGQIPTAELTFGKKNTTFVHQFRLYLCEKNIQMKYFLYLTMCNRLGMSTSHSPLESNVVNLGRKKL